MTANEIIKHIKNDLTNDGIFKPTTEQKEQYIEEYFRDLDLEYWALDITMSDIKVDELHNLFVEVSASPEWKTDTEKVKDVFLDVIKKYNKK